MREDRSSSFPVGRFCPSFRAVSSSSSSTKLGKEEAEMLNDAFVDAVEEADGEDVVDAVDSLEEEGRGAGEASISAKCARKA